MSNLDVLEQIGYTSQNGLVFCNKVKDVDNNSEVLLLAEAQKLGASAVLFRRYYKGKNDITSYKSDISVYIFQKEDSFFNSPENISLHAKIWSAARAEIYIIIGRTKIDIVNARQPAEATKNTIRKAKVNILLEEDVFPNNYQTSLTLKPIRLASDALRKFNDQRFSAYLFANGTFWEQENLQTDLIEKNPYIHLLNYLMYVRKKFLQAEDKLNLSSKSIDKILILSILVKFLEEIKDDNGKHTLREIYRQNKIKSFSQALEEGKTSAILADLSYEFNGKVFEIDEECKSEIEGKSLSLIANFLRGKVNLFNGQIFLWKQYDFKYLPAEVISAIYENFIQAESLREKGETEKGVVYTPIHLVHLLIDEVMPLDKAEEYFANESFKILDPSCGSGVFLVAAFKRMLQWWAINNSTPDNIQYPQAKEAQKIMEQNIFGVDVQPTATLVSIFGLTTALLEKLTPQEIWNNLKFNDLTRNIQTSNFFEWAINAPREFDLVVGNPPFNVQSDKSKDEILDKKLLAELDFKHKNIPGNNFALHFFEASMLLSKKVCLIIPSSVLLYSKSSQKYRKSIFTDFNVQKIYDFTHLRRVLFHKTADTAIIAIIAENKTSNKKNIEHTIIKRIISTENKTHFEIDAYDCHFVPWNWATDETKQFIWKCNLLGGGRLFHLISKVSLLPTLKEFIEKQANWKMIRGFEGGGKYEIDRQDEIIEIFPDGKLDIQSDRTFFSGDIKDLSIYEPPFLILDQVLGKENIPIAFVREYHKQYLYFNRDFVGIHAPKTDVILLEKIYNSVKNDFNDLYRLCALVRSGSCMISTETEINKRDIDSLPFSEDETELDYLKLSESEKIIQDDVLKYYIHLGKSINTGKSGAKLHNRVDISMLKEYGQTFCSLINPTHAENEMFWQVGDVYKTPDESFVAFQFIFGKGKKVQSFDIKEQVIEKIYHDFEVLTSNKEENKGAIFQRVLRWYGNADKYDYVVFIKPNTKRYWLKSIALRDADETIWDYLEEGY